MNKKLLAQGALILIILLIILFFFKIYKKNDNFDKKVQNNLEKKYEPNQDLELKKDIIEGIEYFSKDINGNIYIIRANSGEISKKDPDIINLKNVTAFLTFDENEKIQISSDKAIYNNSNYDTTFFENVLLNYGEHNIKCEKILAKFSENFALLSGNLVYNNISSILYADQMKFDLISRNSEVSMFDQKSKIKIIYKENGTN